MRLFSLSFIVYRFMPQTIVRYTLRRSISIRMSTIRQFLYIKNTLLHLVHSASVVYIIAGQSLNECDQVRRCVWNLQHNFLAGSGRQVKILEYGKIYDADNAIICECITQLSIAV